MSGGSYNYICFADLEELYAKTDDIERMARRLSEIPDAEAAVYATEQILAAMKQTRIRLAAMRDQVADVWHAVEWHDSCDIGEDQLQDAIARFNQGEPETVSGGVTWNGEGVSVG